MAITQESFARDDMAISTECDNHGRSDISLNKFSCYAMRHSCGNGYGRTETRWVTSMPSSPAGSPASMIPFRGGEGSVQGFMSIVGEDALFC